MVPIMFVYLFLIADVSLPSHPGLSNLPWGIFTFCGDFFWRDLLAMVIFEVTPIPKLYLGQFSLELSKVILKLLFEAVFCFQDIAEW